MSNNTNQEKRHKQTILRTTKEKNRTTPHRIEIKQTTGEKKINVCKQI